MDLSNELYRLFLAGVGAAALTAEKGRELVDSFVEKGELTVEQGKVLNEELKHKVDEAVKEHVHVTVVKEEAAEPKAEDLLNAVDKLTPEELEALKKKLNEMEKTNECECDTDEEE